MKKLLVIIATVLTLFGCEEKIDIKLKDQGKPVVVIEGFITTDPGPHYIRVSKTVPYFSANAFDPVQGAQLILKENGTIIETLNEVSPGVYESTTEAKLNTLYQLEATVEGQVYVGTDVATYCPPIDTVDYFYEEGSPFRDDGYHIRMYAYEPPGEQFYRIVLYQNDKRLGGFDNFIFTDDRFVDGNYIDGIEFDQAFELGDKVNVVMYSTSKQVYKFYQSVEFQGGSGGGFDPPPANLNSTISNGAFGYFGVFDKTEFDTVIQ